MAVTMGTQGETRAVRPPPWWWVAAVTCWALTVTAFVAMALGAGLGLVLVGVPGALGLITLGLWVRRTRIHGVP